MLAHVVALPLGVEVAFEVIASKIKVAVVKVNCAVLQPRESHRGRGSEQISHVIDNAKALEKPLEATQLFDHLHRNGIDGP